MSAPLIIRVPGAPTAKGRPKFARRGKFVMAYTPAKTRSYEAAVRACVLDEMNKTQMRMMAGALSVNVEVFVPVPESWSGKKRARALANELLPVTRPDADNYLKALLDAANGVIWRDDSQIVDLKVSKRYGGDPCAVMTIAEALLPLEQARAA